ncbi:MAG: MFS transporter, partial [Anaerolineae bacterium]|nr:MFS transporter [Anaerolineae bacterium]
WQGVYMTLLQSLIDTYGWRTTWIFLGVAIVLTVLPMWWFFMRDTPEQYGLLPDGATPKSAEESEAEAEVSLANSWRLKEAMRTVLFWIFILGRIMPAAFGTGLIFHQVSIFSEMGYSAEVVAQAFGITSIVSAITTIILGRIISRLPRASMAMAFQLFILGGAMFLAMHVTQDWMLWVYTILMGIMIGCGGTFDGTVWADLFGRHYLGEIRGFASTALVAGTSVGPILFGLSFDTFGSYDTVLWVGILAVTIPMILSLFMTKPRRR